MMAAHTEVTADRCAAGISADEKLTAFVELESAIRLNLIGYAQT